LRNEPNAPSTYLSNHQPLSIKRLIERGSGSFRLKTASPWPHPKPGSLEMVVKRKHLTEVVLTHQDKRQRIGKAHRLIGVLLKDLHGLILLVGQR
jgi:hypothetical protein